MAYSVESPFRAELEECIQKMDALDRAAIRSHMEEHPGLLRQTAEQCLEHCRDMKKRGVQRKRAKTLLRKVRNVLDIIEELENA